MEDEERIHEWMDHKKSIADLADDLREKYCQEYQEIEDFLRQRVLPEGDFSKIRVLKNRERYIYFRVAAAVLLFITLAGYLQMKLFPSPESPKDLQLGFEESWQSLNNVIGDDNLLQETVYDVLVDDWGELDEQLWGVDLEVESPETIHVNVVKESCYEAWNHIQFFMENYVDHTSGVSDKPG